MSESAAIHPRGLLGRRGADAMVNVSGEIDVAAMPVRVLDLLGGGAPHLRLEQSTVAATGRSRGARAPLASTARPGHGPTSW